MIKIGDKVLLNQKGVRIIASISHIMLEKGNGEEALIGDLVAATSLFLDSDYGSCKVYMHDKHKTWTAYAELN